MKIVDAVWTAVVNLYKVECERCRTVFLHRADRFRVQCPSCNNLRHLSVLRDDWMKRNQTVAE